MLQDTTTKPGTSLHVVQPNPKAGAAAVAAEPKSILSRSAQPAGMRHPGATYLGHNGQLHGMLTNSSRAYQPPGKYVTNVCDCCCTNAVAVHNSLTVTFACHGVCSMSSISESLQMVMPSKHCNVVPVCACCSFDKDFCCAGLQ